MKKFFFLLVITLFFSACTKQAWLAKTFIVKGEEAFSKAHAMRVRKDDAHSKVRANYYRKACGYFSKAYDTNPSVFTLNRIEEAIDACLRIQDSKHEEIFRAFEEEYVRTHPDEAKYGDAGAYMNLEG